MKLFNITIIKYIFILMILNIVISASEEKEIRTLNNQYSINTNCHEYWSNFVRDYELTFISKNKVFENYHKVGFVDYDNVPYVYIKTDLYTIYPKKVYAENKAIIHIILSE